MYRTLADGVVLVHFGWILFLIFGGHWGARHRGVRMLHVGGLCFALILQVFDWYCPLTHLEGWLRWRDDQAYLQERSFIIHYVEKIVYLELSRPAVFVLTAGLCAFNAWLYLGRRKKLRSR